MTIPRFFFPASLPVADTVELPETLAHHAIKVLRLREDAAIVLFDGSGVEAHARLRGHGKKWHAEMLEYRDISRESPLQLILVQALASGEKMDWIIQKAVELGVAAVIPIVTERCVLKLSGERADKRLAHWRQIVISACEQSGRNAIPAVLPVMSLNEYLKRYIDAEKLIMSPYHGARLADLATPSEALHIMIGPEGGWADDELEACCDAEAACISLGPRILRTETAGLVVLAALQSLWGDY